MMRTPSAFSRSSAAGVDSLIGSAMAIRPCSRPSAATNTTLAPRSRHCSAALRRGAASTPICVMRAVLPTATGLPSTCPRTPMPVDDSKSLAALSAMVRRRASATMASANGCSEPWSRLAASRSTSSSLQPGAATTPWNTGLPSVSVPVLSTISVSIWRRCSIASASLNSTPELAPRPVATMIDIGVASPSAHGQAMISTAMALIVP